MSRTKESNVNRHPPRVGSPKRETHLTAATVEQAANRSPGLGRVLLCLTEVELGVGRPDVLLVTMSKNGLLARARRWAPNCNLTDSQLLEHQT